ncbi:DMT family transporter [Conexivisphaera calida]|uniref:Permease of the drug/metabolite transporter superfamily n=1 Tax=Conexivisphaera calida TaxID=1874277 RepID=A0A4P2VCN3_9ARCH|nr:DMT family transporter [Conexivisphaera calida]BBE42274.1 Permease of the drug/metabolite transporter superfamily [Conexivisphaera calida]
MRGDGRVEAALFSALAIAWALNYPLSKMALRYADPLQLTLLRFIFAILFLAVLMPRGLRPLRGLRTNALTALFGALDLLFSTLLWFEGERYTTPSVASIVIYTYPILITVMGVAVLGERMGRWRALGVALGFTGVAITFSGDLEVYGATGLILLLGAALSFSVAAIIYRKYLVGEDFARVSTYHLIYATILAAAISAAAGSPIPPAHSMTSLLPLLLVISFPGTAVAYTIYVYLYSRHEVTSIAPYLFLVPALSVLLSYVIMGVSVTWSELLGFVPLAAGIYLSSLKR